MGRRRRLFRFRVLPGAGSGGLTRITDWQTFPVGEIVDLSHLSGQPEAIERLIARGVIEPIADDEGLAEENGEE